MIKKFFSTSKNTFTKNILCLGKTDLENPNIYNFSIPEIVSFFTNLSSSQVYFLNQEHDTKFHYVPQDFLEPPVGDALFTDKKNIALVIKTADCIPLFFWSKSKDWIGLIHSGWRGTAKGITQKVISYIQNKFNISDLEFFMGPCIRQNNYEVGRDVAFQFKHIPETLIPLENNKFLFSNDLAVQIQLRQICPTSNLEDCRICNYSDPNYYSYRRGDKERNLNIIWMSE